MFPHISEQQIDAVAGALRSVLGAGALATGAR
jgi:hypothetical protein